MLEEPDIANIGFEPQNEEGPSFPEILGLWQDHPEDEDTVIVPGVAEIVTPNTLPNILNDLLYSEIRTADMTNLGNTLLGYPTEGDPVHDDAKVGRLSLAHEKLTYMPQLICDEFGPIIKILDISNNQIKNFDFLEHFTELTSLIADKNPINSLDTNIPWMSKLELLYLNHCKIDDLFWVETLKFNCPNLKYLSLMGNPVVPSFMTGGNVYQCLRYRFYVISAIPSLIHLDDKQITDDERLQAQKMYPTPYVRNLFKTTRTRFPYYLRRVTVSEIPMVALEFELPSIDDPGHFDIQGDWNFNGNLGSPDMQRIIEDSEDTTTSIASVHQT